MSDGLGDPLDFEVVVASLRTGREELGSYLSALAAKLSRALPGQVEVSRSGLLGGRRIRGLSIDLGGERYTISERTGRLECTIATVVRGVVLRSDSCDLDDWLQGLSGRLVTMADESQAARAALERIVR